MTVEHEIYCMNCFALIPAQAETCPACGGRAALLSRLEYRQKLLHALEHPLDDVRMRAIIAIGLRRDAEVSLALAACALRHPLNIEEGLAVVAVLNDMRAFPDSAQALQTLAHRHAAHAVRAAAETVLKQAPIR
jgi:hypothetical protein